MAEVAVANETCATFSRKTRDGRTLRYEMSILQQPQRARACGAGAKSSADRRPVDPPPVVELKIFHGEHDVTFAHNASFFLYTTLESARQIATPKGGALSPQTPVLTGTPVAGMVYLDRPCHAGYFIFPDLSVRHEGRYRLSFNLFEDNKDDNDKDPENENPNMDHPSAKLLYRSPSNPRDCVHFRMEVKSEPFNVFSAKKFPGLTESTDLSRCVAEQGCRVRIRRDVRIRVRKDMNSVNDDFNRESSEARNERVATPGPMDQTPLSRPANNVAPTYPAIESKTAEQQYIKQSPFVQNANLPQPAPQSQYPGSQFSYGNASQQYPSNNGTIQPPPPPAYAAPQFPQHAQHSRHNSASSSQDFHHQQHQFSAPQHPITNPTSVANPAYTVAIDTKFQIQPQSYQNSIAPDSASTSKSSILPALPNISSMVAASPISYDQNVNSSTKTKRGYSTVFNDVNSSTPVQFGARNETSGQELPLVETEEHGIITQDELARMRESVIGYRRADGRIKYRQLPKRSIP